MTVCIAAIPHFNTQTVLSDRMISNDWSSVESEAPKIWTPTFFHSDWLTMFAGDPGTAYDVIGQIGTELGGNRDFDEPPVKVSTHELMSLISAVYQKTIRRDIESTVLAPYGLDVSHFLQLGTATFGDAEFTRICAAIESVQLDLEMLVVGSDRQNFRGLFSVDQRGVCVDRTPVGFHAIGSGRMDGSERVANSLRSSAHRSACRLDS